YPANVDVKELADFNSVGKEAYQTLEATGLDMLRALALYLGLDENYFDAHVHNGNSILRPIHYPPITEEPKDAVRAAEHGDINLITLLMGASADGLQVLNKANEWIPVTALPGQIIVNVGDMMQRHTNNKLRSTIHRVVNPPKEKWAQSRFSIPFFMHPRSEMPLNCLEECITENNPKAYEDITAGGFLEERLKEIGLKK
ncbi:MAG: isopenicillin N synthase family dioxygenase, partial [Croceimicrobium sp.]